MKYLLQKSGQPLKGNIFLPASKSISNRLLIIQALSGGFEIENLSDSNDTKVLQEALNSHCVLVDIGPAGTAMRFSTAYYSFVPGTRMITGSERMKNRPIGQLVDALRQLGASIDYMEKEGFPPLKISGVLPKKNVVEIDGSISSQFISALLLVAPSFPEGLTIKLRGKVISSSYIHLTLDLMRQLGVESDWQNDEIMIRHQEYHQISYRVESDWSAASYWYEMVALSSEADIFLVGLSADSIQGDVAIARLFEPLGVKTTYLPDGIRLSKVPTATTNMEFDFSNNPDMVQTFCVTLAMLGIPFRFSGCESLKIKETNRVAALQTELLKFGVHLMEPESGSLAWDGQYDSQLAEVPEIDTYADHRMAMAFAPAVLKNSQLVINDPEVVMKSYPGFWNDIASVGLNYEQLL